MGAVFFAADAVVAGWAWAVLARAAPPLPRAAADLLHMTQPALSRQIIALEHDLGFRLFDRDRRGTSLTNGGRQLLEDAIPLLSASTALERRWRGAVAELQPWPASDLRRPPTIEEKLERVALDEGIVVLPAGVAGFYSRPDISYVPVVDVRPRMVALAYNKHRAMPELEEFAKLATSMLGNGGEP